MADVLFKFEGVNYAVNGDARTQRANPEENEVRIKLPSPDTRYVRVTGWNKLEPIQPTGVEACGTSLPEDVRVYHARRL